ncbi:hypothetical protein ACPCBC_17335 [Streptomyces incarnatus]|uniref:hypothetical protein n=1 Tax=Streptomyces sp. HF10 TaxID=2692233 RepID=UPI001315D937|nr:hypothetical protein [Streptomyces sp. HF10]QHC31100.1 hypothetical protein GR129_22230 [Streptomyces sp. HF10]
MAAASPGLTLALLLTITVLLALLAGISAAWLRSAEGATKPAAVLRGGGAFAATLTVCAAFLAILWR